MHSIDALGSLALHYLSEYNFTPGDRHSVYLLMFFTLFW